MRRFPPPWTIEPLDAGYKVVDANGQVLAYVYGLDDSRDARIAKALTRDEATRIASNIARGDGQETFWRSPLANPLDDELAAIAARAKLAECCP